MSARGLLSRRKGLYLVILVVIQLALILSSASPAAAWAQTLTATIIGPRGDVKGTATFTRLSTGEVQVDIEVKGFDPIGGDRRLAIQEYGVCNPPGFTDTGWEVAQLPNIQLYPDGSANYHVITNAVNFDQLTDANGSAVVIRADTAQTKPVIGCGVIVPFQTAPPPYVPPTPPPYVPPTPPPPSADFGSPTTVVAPVGLKMRYGPSLAEPVVLILANGATVYPSSLTRANQGITWIYVRYYSGGRAFDGWVAATYLARYAGTTPTDPGGLKVTAGSGLRLRSGPSTAYAIQRIVPFGTILQATGVEQWSGGILWTKVRFNGTALWAAKQYLQPV